MVATTKSATTTQDPQIPPLDRCLLLELPRELRDIVYFHAFSYSGGLAVEISINKAKSQVPYMRVHGRHNQYLTQTPANILKLVCRQLREETRSLIFKSNSDIALYGMTYVTPSSYSFGLFVSRFSSKTTHTHLKRVTVHGYPGVEAVSLLPTAFREMSDYAAGFKPFCKLYPQTLVILQFRNVFDVEPDSWFYWAGALQVIIRGASPLVTPRTQPHFLAQLTKISNAFANTSQLPNNLRFSLLEIFPRHDVENELRYYREMGAYSENQSENLMLVARSLFDNGI